MINYETDTFIPKQRKYKENYDIVFWTDDLHSEEDCTLFADGEVKPMPEEIEAAH